MTLSPRHQSRHAGRRQHRALVCHERAASAAAAPLVLHGGGHRWRAHAEGNGAIDALMSAVDVALAPLLGDGVALATYDVHASGPGHDVGRVGVRVDPPPRRRGRTLYPGRAVSENVLEASSAPTSTRSTRCSSTPASTLLPPSHHPARRTRTRPIRTTTHGKDRIMSAYNH